MKIEFSNIWQDQLSEITKLLESSDNSREDNCFIQIESLEAKFNYGPGKYLNLNFNLKLSVPIIYNTQIQTERTRRVLDSIINIAEPSEGC